MPAPNRSGHQPHHGVRSGAILASITSNMLGLLFPLVMLQVYNRILPLAAWGTLIALASAVVVAALLDGFLRLARVSLLADAGARYEHELATRGFEALLHADLVAFSEQSRGSYLNRFMAIERLREHHFGQGLILLLDIPFAVVFLALIWMVAGTMVLVPLALVAAFIVVSLISERRLRASLTQTESQRRASSDFLLECIEGMHTLKALAAEAPMRRRYERLVRQSALAVADSSMLHGWVQALGTCFSQLVMVSFVAIGSALVVRGELTVGALAAGSLLAGRVLDPALKGLRLLTARESARFARDEFESLVGLKSEPMDDTALSPVLSGAIEVRGLSFRYPGSPQALFDNLDLTVRAGEMVGIVGDNGAGKTSLINLLLGFMEPDAGTITFDGHPLATLSRTALRSQFALVPQEGVLIDGTLLDNLTFYRGGNTVREALNLATRLGLDQTMARLPDGSETRITGLVESMPLGMRQRLTIVRALAGRPPALLFDDANTGFDAANDRRLIGLLEQLRSTTTIVMVTQRPSMLRLCDRVLHLDGGHLVPAPQAPATDVKRSGVGSERSQRQVA
jgi:ATP-binding cassette, subfamily C, bacterial LapB